MMKEESVSSISEDRTKEAEEIITKYQGTVKRYTDFCNAIKSVYIASEDLYR